MGTHEKFHFSGKSLYLVESRKTLSATVIVFQLLFSSIPVTSTCTKERSFQRFVLQAVAIDIVVDVAGVLGDHRFARRTQHSIEEFYKPAWFRIS